MEKKTATLVKTLPFNGAAWQKLYKVTPPMWSHSNEGPWGFVIASASKHANEVYLFGADEDGDIQDWLELPGSMKGTMRHENALENAGYEVTP